MTAVLSPSVAPSARRARIDADAAVDRGVRTVTGLLIWAGLLLVTFWWDTDGGITDLAGWESGLTSIGRLTGLWSADLLLVQVLLMSRLPPLEHAFGRDRLARIHRVDGVLVVRSDARPHRHDRARLRRCVVVAGASHHVGPGHDVRRRSACPRGHGVSGHGRGHEREEGTAPASVRVLAPAPPLRLPRGRARPTPPALDRSGVPAFARRHALLVEPVDRRRRRDPALAGCPTAGAEPAVQAAGHLGGPRVR